MAVRRLVKALELFFLKQAKENLSIFQKNGLRISVTRLVIVYKLRLDCRHTKIFQESSKQNVIFTGWVLISDYFLQTFTEDVSHQINKTGNKKEHNFRVTTVVIPVLETKPGHKHTNSEIDSLQDFQPHYPPRRFSGVSAMITYYRSQHN